MLRPSGVRSEDLVLVSRKAITKGPRDGVCAPRRNLVQVRSRIDNINNVLYLDETKAVIVPGHRPTAVYLIEHDILVQHCYWTFSTT